FFIQTNYVGAFGPNVNWMKGWTALDQLGYLAGDVSTSIELDRSSDVPAAINLAQNYPNPFNPTTTIQFELPAAQQINLTVYNIMGQQVAELVSGRLTAGSYSYNFD
ncbi:T9SS type A sorting domain-containing protein, partial [Arthrospira platensis SPKY1]|nr:T9SS type A sorting domain-containing protein [Arthrospira platensis SPKY1]